MSAAHAWTNGGIASVGAVTWVDGTRGITGTVSAENSLVGSTENDSVGSNDITALNNGNYVVASSSWNNGSIVDAGAVTWMNGSGAITGTVSVTNSLVGSSTSDFIGDNVVVLTNGNYVVQSYNWNNGSATDAGAVTWGNGTSGITGTVSITNSLVGFSTDDEVGFIVQTLSNSNYVVLSTSRWGSGRLIDVGVATWVDGSTGLSATGNGPLTPQNSILGQDAKSGIAYRVIDDIANGSFILRLASDDGGRVISAFPPGHISYARGAAHDFSIAPAAVATSLTSGAAVALQASSDLTISDTLSISNQLARVARSRFKPGAAC